MHEFLVGRLINDFQMDLHAHIAFDFSQYADQSVLQENIRFEDRLKLHHSDPQVVFHPHQMERHLID